MRLTSFNWSYPLAFALTSFAIATVIAARTPQRYTSIAEIRIAPSGVDFRSLTEDFDPHLGPLLSRRSLQSLIESPNLNLYTRERAILPMADLTDRMRKALKVDISYPDRQAIKAVVTFSGEDPGKARATVQKLVGRMLADYAARPQRLVPGPQVIQSPTLPFAPSGLNSIAIGIAAAWISAIPKAGLTTATLIFDSAATRRDVLANLDILLVAQQRSGYQIAITTDQTETGLRVWVKGPDEVQASNMPHGISERIKRSLRPDQWAVLLQDPIPESARRKPDPPPTDDAFEFTWPISLGVSALTIGLIAIITLSRGHWPTLVARAAKAFRYPYQRRESLQ